MERYEALVLTVPEITQEESRRIESEIERILKGSKAAKLSFDRWGKYKLSYPVKKNDYGVYFLARFETEQKNGDLLENLKTLFAVNLNDIVMRHLISSLDHTQTLEYERPLSVEEAPSKEVHGFFKDHKGDHEGAGRGREESSLEDSQEA